MHRNIEVKVGIFLTTVFIVTVILTAFVAYRKGVFEEYSLVKIISSSGQQISKQMPVMFSGFEIGKITNIDLNDKAEVVLTAEIPKKHMKWINNSTEFTLEKPLIGSAKIVVKTPNLGALPLEGFKKIKVIDGIDETISKTVNVIEEVDKILSKITPVVEKTEGVVANIETITTDMKEKESLMAMVTGKNSSGDNLNKTIENLHNTTISLNKMLTNIDGSIYGEKGIIADIKQLFLQLNEILMNINKVSQEVVSSSEDLNSTRNEIDLAIKNANDLIVEIDSKIPFKNKRKVKLP